MDPAQPGEPAGVHGVIDLRDAEERRAAAGEYVLGTLAEDDRAAVESTLPNDAALAAEVYAWQDRLLGLSERATPAEPSAQLWQRISVALDGTVAIAPAARASRPARPARTPWWQRLGLWQGISGLAVAASLAMAVFLAGSLRAPDAGAARYLAVLQSPADRATGWVVEIEAGRSVRLVPVAAGAAVPAGKSLQFWTKPQGAAGPTSLGLVEAGTALTLPVSRLPAVGVEQLFEITLEPEAGSPIGRPTGPILYVGRSVLL